MDVSKILQTRRGNVCIYVNGYKLRKIRSFANGDVKFACTKKNCAFIAHTTPDYKRITEFRNNHYLGKDVDDVHPPYDADTIRMDCLRSDAKRKAVDDLNVRPSKIVKTANKAREDEEEGFADITYEQFKLLRRSVYWARRKKFPKLPKNLQEARNSLHRLKDHYKTQKGENFCFSDSEQEIFIFTTQKNLQILCESEEVYGDGTFDYAPKYFTQLYTLHAYKNGYSLPLVFVYLPKKDEASYNKMWTTLKNLCIDLVGQPLDIPVFVADFEKAAHNSVRQMED